MLKRFSPYMLLSLRAPSLIQSRRGSNCIFKGKRFFTLKLKQIDHCAFGVRDLEVSKKWYAKVLSMDHLFADDPNFNGEIAMVGNGAVKLALLELPTDQNPLPGSRYQRGHVAFEVSNEEFWAFKDVLSKLLVENRACENQRTDIIEEDYGIQKSLFFFDPDDNELEVTTWI